MLQTRNVKDISGEIDLIETYSDENFKIEQIETGRIYGASVVDAIPLRFTYRETDEKDEPPAPPPYDPEEEEITGAEILAELEAML